jgi:branched-chain amino acid transport system permease protein
MEKFIALLASALAYGAVVALVAVGLLVLVKATGVINLAQGELITTSAFVALWATRDLHLSLWLAYLISLAAVAVIALLLEMLITGPLKGKSVNVILVATLAVGLVIRALLSLWQGADSHPLAGPVGAGYLSIDGAQIAKQRVLLMVVSAVCVIVAMLVFQRTDFGRQVRALAADGEAARICGIRVGRVSRLAFVLSGLLAGVAGLMLAPLNGVDLTFGFNTMLVAFAAVTLGGFTSLAQTAFASLGIGILQQLVGGYIFTQYAAVLPFAVMLIAVIARPKGVLGSSQLARV